MRRTHFVSLCLLLLVASLIAAADQAQIPRGYRILVTNDDGIRAPGLLALAQALTAVGEVTVVAPADNQSGKGHSLTLTEPIYLEQVALPEVPAAYAATATPATCVKLAIASVLTVKPDLVVSGINRGQNVGRVSYVSGTAGAAREAALQGIPAIAASLMLAERGEPSYAAAARVSRQVAEMVKAQGLAAGVFLNVNVPPGPPEGIKGLRLATQSPLTGTERFVEHQRPPANRRYFWSVYTDPRNGAEPDDVWALEQGYAAVVPLRASEFDREAFEKLRAAIR